MANEGLNASNINTKDILLENRRLFLTGELTDESVEKVIVDLMVLEGISKEPIELFINSCGGSVDAGLALYDVMQVLKAPIITCGLGQVSSMASVILVAGTERMAFPNCTIMIHEAAGGIQAHSSDVEVYATELRRINTVLVTLLAKHSKRSKADLKNDIKVDHYITAKIAVKYGFIDKIIQKRNK